jgi:CBS-domain-containing membrane protein
MRDAKMVKDLMISDVAVIRDDADVHELEKRLLKDRIHGMPVVDASGMLVGVVSQTDLIAWHYFTGVDGVPFYSAHGSMIPYEEDSSLRLSDVRTADVSELMSPIVYCICPDQSIALAAARMIARQIHRLVVVDDSGRVIGIVTATDLLRMLPDVEQSLEEAEVERALCDVPQKFPGIPVRASRTME